MTGQSRISGCRSIFGGGTKRKGCDRLRSVRCWPIASFRCDAMDQGFKEVPQPALSTRWGGNGAVVFLPLLMPSLHRARHCSRTAPVLHW